MRHRLVTSGTCEEGCISSYGTFGVQGPPQHSQADFAAYPWRLKIPILTGGVKNMCISYRGGKKRVAKKIVECLPRGELFVDVFGGSGCVSTAAVRSDKYNQVVYNDLDSNVVIFLKIVRDRPDDLIEYLCSTPIGRYLSGEIDSMLQSSDEVEKAAGVFFACNFQGQPVAARRAGFYRPRICHKNSIGAGKSTLHGRLKKLQAVVDDLSEIYFENRPAERILELYPKAPKSAFASGDVNIVFFLHPPYGPTQDYPQKFNDHESLLRFFLDTEWTVALCGEENQFPELADYEFFLFVDSKGNPTSTFKRGGFRQGMYMKFRDGWKTGEMVQ